MNSFSPARIARVTEVVKKYVSDFNKSHDTEDSKRDFLSIYHPEVKWADHAFLVRREGHEAVFGLQKSFTYCNKPFRAELKRLDYTLSGATTEIVWVGRMTNDIVRPSGQVAVKATGKDFVTHTCVLLELNRDGKITRLDEFYNKQWDDGRSERDYVVITGASMKVSDQE